MAKFSKRAPWLIVLVIGGGLSLSACSSEGDPPLDGAVSDGGPADSLVDFGQPDEGPRDAPVADREIDDAADAGLADSEGFDADPTDADPTDADPTDADPTDADPADADPTDADPADADPTDADPAETGPVDGGGADMGPPDTGDVGPYRLVQGNVPIFPAFSGPAGSPIPGMGIFPPQENVGTMVTTAQHELFGTTFAPGTSVSVSSFGVVAFGTQTATVGANGLLPVPGLATHVAPFWDETIQRISNIGGISDVDGLRIFVYELQRPGSTTFVGLQYNLTLFAQGHRVRVEFFADSDDFSGTIGLTDGVQAVQLPCSPNCSPRAGDIYTFYPTNVVQVGADLAVIPSGAVLPAMVAPGEASPIPDIRVENRGNISQQPFDYYIYANRPGEFIDSSVPGLHGGVSTQRGIAPGTSIIINDRSNPNASFSYPTDPGDWVISVWAPANDYEPANDILRMGTVTVANTTCEITTSQLPVGTVGVAYQAQLTTTGCPSPTWSVLPALPSGLTLTAATGQISGQPTAASAGMYTFTATQALHPLATRTLNLLVQ